MNNWRRLIGIAVLLLGLATPFALRFISPTMTSDDMGIFSFLTAVIAVIGLLLTPFQQSLTAKVGYSFLIFIGFFIYSFAIFIWGHEI